MDLADELIELFNHYDAFLGLSNADFPDYQPQDKQCEFEEKFKALICKHRGHEIGPDQCGKPEHDYCYRCNALRVDIEGVAK